MSKEELIVGKFLRHNIQFRIFRDGVGKYSGYCGSIGLDGDIKCTDSFLVNTDEKGSFQWVEETWRSIDKDRNADIVCNLDSRKIYVLDKSLKEFEISGAEDDADIAVLVEKILSIIDKRTEGKDVNEN